MRLAGKTAIVTGGASGFGAGITHKFLDEGARVMIADINGAAAEAIAAELLEKETLDGPALARIADAARSPVASLAAAGAGTHERTTP